MNPWILFLGVVLSSVGLGYALYGRKQQAGVPLVCGVALMLVPYFVSSAIALGAIGLVLGALPWVWRR